MKCAKYLKQMKKIEENFLEFLENLESVEENFRNLKIKFEKMKIRSKLNYCRGPTFFSKIERTLQLFKNDIKNYYSNSEIFNIFKSNKRVLLFLIKDGFITIDESIVKKITSDEFSDYFYPQYFEPEINQFLNEKCLSKDMNSKNLNEELNDDFDEFRNNGENENFICKLIREDLIEDFITYVSKKCISPNAIIKPSIYETNSFLLENQTPSKKGISLIEYAAFFGSIQIFTFLKNTKADLTPSLWLYVIHGKKAELIHLLEELHIIPTIFYDDDDIEKKYEECFIESIKCHHNGIANYFINNYSQKNDENFIQFLEYYNFSLLAIKCINKSSFCHLCHFDYYSLVEVLLTNKDIDVNAIIIHDHIFQFNSRSYLSM